MACRGLVLAGAVCLQLLGPGACLSLGSSRAPAREENRTLRTPPTALWKRTFACNGARRGADALQMCLPCAMRGRAAPQLWIQESKDGAGNRLHNIIAAMAFASRHGMNFGGVVSYNTCNHKHLDLDHGEDILDLVHGMFELDDPSLLFSDVEPKDPVRFLGIDSLLANLSSLKEGQNVLLTAAYANSMSRELVDSGRKMDDYFTPWFMAALRTQRSRIRRMPLHFKKGRPTVAMHVRRGDIFVDGNAADRITPDEWYFRMVDHIKQRFGEMKPDIHVFTALQGKGARWGPDGKNLTLPIVHNESEFQEYRDRGMTMHYDGSSLEAWAHFVRADVFLMAKSEFSYVPALFSKECVVWQHFWQLPVADWTQASDGNWLRRTLKPKEFWFDPGLDRCIDGVKDRLRREWRESQA